MNGRRPLRICIASWAPFIGGAEVAAERLALGLQQAGHEVFLVLGTSGPVLERMTQAGLRCLHSPMYFTDKWHWWRYRKARKALRDIFRAERPDVVHSNDLPTHQIVSDALRGVSIPEICHHRWIFPGPAIDWLNKFGARRHLFVSQAFMEEMCLSAPRLRLAPCRVVHDGLPLPSLLADTDRQQLRLRLGLPADKPIVLFVGQVVPHKGVDDLLRAWSMLPDADRNAAELAIVGEDFQNAGTHRREMMALAESLNVSARWLGFQPNAGDWQSAADIAVVPSHVEPFGLVVIEAMARCVPVIGARVGGIPEMIVPEETGILVDPQNPPQLARALHDLLTDPERRRRFGEQSRRRCEEFFSLDSHVQYVLAEYEAVLSTRRLVAAL